MTVKSQASREFARRLAKLQVAISRRRLDAMIVHEPNNVYYYTGLRASLAYLLVTRREAVLMVDGRYVEAAAEAAPHCSVRLFKVLAQSLEGWFKDAHPAAVGFEDASAWNAVQQWQAAMPGAQFKGSGDLISQQRVVKSPAEIRIIERSAALNDRVYERGLAAAVPGSTEMDIRNAIRRAADDLGAESESFECIVAAGAMSSRPHYNPAARHIEAGQLLLIDLGVKVDGYCSDMTRTVGVSGRPIAQKLRKMFDAVLEAQEAGLAALGPGVACAEVYNAARNALKKHRLEKRFTHGLGHGVGLEIHEGPTLNSRTRETLRAGMIVTIEPGVYIPGVGGVRIEDLAVVTRTGCRVLSRAEKAWREV